MVLFDNLHAGLDQLHGGPLGVARTGEPPTLSGGLPRAGRRRRTGHWPALLMLWWRAPVERHTTTFWGCPASAGSNYRVARPAIVRKVATTAAGRSELDINTSAGRAAGSATSSGVGGTDVPELARGRALRTAPGTHPTVPRPTVVAPAALHDARLSALRGTLGAPEPLQQGRWRSARGALDPATSEPDKVASAQREWEGGRPGCHDKAEQQRDAHRAPQDGEQDEKRRSTDGGGGQDNGANEHDSSGAKCNNRALSFLGRRVSNKRRIGKRGYTPLQAVIASIVGIPTPHLGNGAVKQR